VTDLRVALVHWCLPPTTGGVESHLADLASSLTRAGCHVTVITGEERPEPMPGVEIVSTPLLNIDGIRDGLASEPGYDTQLTAVLGEALADRHVDIVHAHQLHHFAPQPALVLDGLRRRLDFRLHHTFHETWPDLLHETPVYHNWDGNYAVSEYVRNECAERIGIVPRLLHLGIDTERFTEGPTQGRHQRELTVLHPARLMPWKGVHISVQAMGRLRERGIVGRLLVTDTVRIADWKRELEGYRSDIVQLIDQLHLSEQVEFVSARYAEMPALYQRADVVIYPTVEPEPFGLVPLEAMSSKRPVVASAIGGIVETVVDGETGFLVPAGDAVALADRLAELHDQPALRRAMGEAGRARVLQRFDIRGLTAELLRSYHDSLISVPRRPHDP
jgi:glycosyltransferase involved in cell wall biosynthesis